MDSNLLKAIRLSKRRIVPSIAKQAANSPRNAEKVLGQVSYELTEKQKKGRDFSRSLYVVKDIKKGEVITEENVRSVRPGFGMHPMELKNWLGKEAPKDLERVEKFYTASKSILKITIELLARIKNDWALSGMCS